MAPGGSSLVLRGLQEIWTGPFVLKGTPAGRTKKNLAEAWMLR